MWCKVKKPIQRINLMPSCFGDVLNEILSNLINPRSIVQNFSKKYIIKNYGYIFCLKLFQNTTNSGASIVYILLTVIAIVGLIAAFIHRHLDVIDKQNNQVVPLCGKNGDFKYEVTVVTGRRYGAGKRNLFLLLNFTL